MLRAAAIHLDFSRIRVGWSYAQRGDPAATVRRVLEVPDSALDYATAKITFDTLVDPTVDSAAILHQIDNLTAKALTLAAGDGRPSAKLGAVRTLLYEPGPWNDNRPFSYDQSDPAGRLIHNKLLHNYLRTRLGQCVSMPVLFLIVAQRLGLDVALASAPEHVFVRYRDETGREHNLETTSGAHPARDEWFRHKFPITDRSVESGLYLRTLTARAAIALMASTVLEHLNAQHRFEEVIAVSKIVLRHDPRDVHAMLCLGSAAGRLLDQLRAQHPNPWAAPPELRARAFALMEQNKRWFAAAENLGWVPFE